MSLLYFLLIPFVSAFNLSSVAVLPLIASFMLMTWRTVNLKMTRLALTLADRLAICFLVSVGIATVANIMSLEQKNLNHLLGVFSSFVFFYFGLRAAIGRVSVMGIFRALHWSYMFSTVFAVVEFYLVNVKSVSLGFIPRPNVEAYTPLFLGGLFVRSRSLFEESGHYASYLSVMIPVMVYYLWWIRKSTFLRLAFIVMTLGAVFTIFSVSMFLFFPLAVACTMLLNSAARGRIDKKSAAVILLFLGLGLAIVSSETLRDAMFTDKFSGGSFEDRHDKFLRTIELMLNADFYHVLFGYGPGSYVNLGIRPAISVYINFLRDFGLLGLTTYCLFCFATLVEIYRTPGSLGMLLFVAALVGFLFFVAIPDYYYPHFFLPLLLRKILPRDLFCDAGRKSESSPPGFYDAVGAKGF